MGTKAVVHPLASTVTLTRVLLDLMITDFWNVLFYQIFGLIHFNNANLQNEENC